MDSDPTPLHLSPFSNIHSLFSTQTNHQCITCYRHLPDHIEAVLNDLTAKKTTDHLFLSCSWQHTWTRHFNRVFHRTTCWKPIKLQVCHFMETDLLSVNNNLWLIKVASRSSILSTDSFKIEESAFFVVWPIPFKFKFKLIQIQVA